MYLTEHITLGGMLLFMHLMALGEAFRLENFKADARKEHQ
jgi:hypothetical protein